MQLIPLLCGKLHMSVSKRFWGLVKGIFLWLSVNRFSVNYTCHSNCHYFYFYSHHRNICVSNCLFPGIVQTFILNISIKMYALHTCSFYFFMTLCKNMFVMFVASDSLLSLFYQHLIYIYINTYIHVCVYILIHTYRVCLCMCLCICIWLPYARKRITSAVLLALHLVFEARPLVYLHTVHSRLTGLWTSEGFSCLCLSSCPGNVLE